jgi:hypothetical protein
MELRNRPRCRVSHQLGLVSDQSLCVLPQLNIPRIPYRDRDIADEAIAADAFDRRL